MPKRNDLGPAAVQAILLAATAGKLDAYVDIFSKRPESRLSPEELTKLETLLNDAYNAHRDLCKALQPWLGTIVDEHQEAREALGG